LLPPEEIWYDNNQMPLDVWRLISFEIDMVSTSVAAQVPIDDIAFGSLSQTGLVFRAMMARLQKRQVEFEVSIDVDLKTFSKLPAPSVRRIDVVLGRLFLDAGCLLTHCGRTISDSGTPRCDNADWILATGKPLMVRDEYDRDSVDSRYRGLFAEEMAIGLMAVVLVMNFGRNRL